MSALAHYVQGVTLLGALLHLVASFGKSCEGVAKASSTSAELAAIIWACIWLLSCQDAVDAQILLILLQLLDLPLGCTTQQSISNWPIL